MSQENEKENKIQDEEHVHESLTNFHDSLNRVDQLLKPFLAVPLENIEAGVRIFCKVFCKL